MTGTSLDPFESQFEHQYRFDTSDWSKFLYSILLNPSVYLEQLLIRQAGICLRERNQFSLIPYGKRIVGKQVCPTAVSRLGIDQDRINCHGVRLPFPPPAAFTSHQIGRASCREGVPPW